MRRKLKGFTLVELLVAMAIIAVLIALAGFGITLALRASRDSQRRSTLDSVRVALSDYLATNNAYPTSVTYNATANAIVVGTTNVPVKGHLIPASTGDSDSSKTKYCYGIATTGYYLGVQLENKSYYDLGTESSKSCAPPSVVIK